MRQSNRMGQYAFLPIQEIRRRRRRGSLSRCEQRKEKWDEGQKDGHQGTAKKRYEVCVCEGGRGEEEGDERKVTEMREGGNKHKLAITIEGHIICH